MVKIFSMPLYVMSFTDKIYSAQETFFHYGENHRFLLLDFSPSSTQPHKSTRAAA